MKKVRSRNLLDILKEDKLEDKVSKSKGVFGYTPLHEAVASGKPEVLDSILKKTNGAHVNCKANNDYTPLHLAASSGHERCARVLLRHGANIGILDKFGKTPQQSAEASCRGNIVRLLRSEEIIKQVECNGEKLTELLRIRADQLEPDCLNRALVAATRNDNQNNIGKLILKGASNLEECLQIAITEKKPHSRAILLLIRASISGNKNIVKKLFGDSSVDASKLDPQEFDDDRFPDVQRAIRRGIISTAVPIEIARLKGNGPVREELLVRTDVNQKDGSIYWHGLRLLSLEISWLRRVAWVKRLRLARNGFKSLPPEMGTYLKQVVKLDLQHNELTHIPSCLLELPSLEDLNLSHNSLEDLPNTQLWSASLSVLDLSHNQLTAGSFSPNVSAQAICTLNLSSNQLRHVPLCICSFTTLQNLDLSDNLDIAILPTEMGRLSALSSLNLSSLKDLNDPPKQFHKDTDHCMRYLKAKLRSVKGFFKMKLMLVGQANRGKTTLVARLQGRECGNESTVGVDVSEWSYKPSFGRNKFHFSIWDFGGQEEYYATHQCFLSQNSLYLLLFNLKHGEDGVQELKSWLNNIALRAPNSCVLIVGTHLDEMNEGEREAVAHVLQSAGNLANLYTNKLKISQVIPVGLDRTAENLGLLKDAIYNNAAEYTTRRGHKIMGQEIPASYHALDKQLETVRHEVRQGLREPIMHAEEFKTMVHNMSLPDMHDDDELKTATLFLTDVGSLLHYDDRGHNLHELYFVDPRWLCDMMSKIVTIRERNPFVKQGLLYSKHIPVLLKDNKFPWQYFEQYLTLLDRFEIALPLDNRRVLIPSMLPKERPKQVVQEEEKLNETLVYKRFIIFSSADTPPGFWSRLLSRIMHSIPQVTSALDKIIPNEISTPTLQSTIGTSFKLPPFAEETSEQINQQNSPPSSENEDVLTPRSKTTPINRSFQNSDSVTPRPKTLPVNRRPPLISDPMSMISPGAPLMLPHFPKQLSLDLDEAPQLEYIVLQYWRTGVFYKDLNVMFGIESLTNSAHSGTDKGRGVLLYCSANTSGLKVIGHLVDLVLALVEEWYPGLGERIKQIVSCFECIKLGRAQPFEFQVDQCLSAIAKNDTSMECKYFENEPTNNHTVALADIVPDLLLQDIDSGFLLEQKDIIYKEDDDHLLGKGGFGEVYRGKCHNQSVAIKKYLHKTETAFTELRLEAKLLQQSHHPCFVCLVGVCVYPIMALVMEEAPLGSLDVQLFDKKTLIHRVTVLRIAMEVAAALRFIHRKGIIFRDLKAANILLWTLDPNSLCHCKVTDFGIATHLSPVGAKGIHGTKGFIAPEVLHIGKRRQKSVYDHKADIFSFAMLLYQLIARRHPYHDVPEYKVDAFVEDGARPKLQDVDQASNAYHYLTKLMEDCWKDNPKSRPDTSDIITKLCTSPMQNTMAVTPIKSKFSLRRAIAITSADFTQASSHQLNSELWVCCDGAEGVEVNMYNTHTMMNINKSSIKDHQVQAITKCNNHVWVGSQAGMDYGVVFIFSIASREHVHKIKLRENPVSCMTSTEQAVYIGTKGGYCFRFLSDVNQTRAEKPIYKYVSETAVDGIVCTQQCVWVAHTKYIYFMSLDTLNLEDSIYRNGDDYIGQLLPSSDGTVIWSAHLGGTKLTAWDALKKTEKFDINIHKHLAIVGGSVRLKDRVMTAMTPALDCVWVGMASGHILVFHNEELLTWFHPYTDYVRFLTVLPCSGPCGMEECMVASGGKGFKSMISDLGHDLDNASNDTQVPNDKEGVLVLWETFNSKIFKQNRLVKESAPEIFDNHHSLKQVIMEGEFKDGTHIINKPETVSAKESETNFPDTQAQPTADLEINSPPKQLENSTSRRFSSLGGSFKVYDPLGNIQEDLTSSSSSAKDNSQILTMDSFAVIPEDPFENENNPLVNQPQLETETHSFLLQKPHQKTTENHFPLVKPRRRAATVITSSIKASAEILEINLPAKNEVVRIACPKPPQLKVVINEIATNISMSPDDIQLAYNNNIIDPEVSLHVAKSDTDVVLICTQDDFDKYSDLVPKPQMFMSPLKRAS